MCGPSIESTKYPFHLLLTLATLCFGKHYFISFAIYICSNHNFAFLSLSIYLSVSVSLSLSLSLSLSSPFLSRSFSFPEICQ